MLAATVRVTRDLDAAEEAVQEAYVQALRTWVRDGVPARPGAWLTTVARRVALNGRRRQLLLQRKLPLVVPDGGVPPDPVWADTVGPDGPAGVDGSPELAGPAEPLEFVDDRLRLVFTCCHPALRQEAQVALTPRMVCGLATPEIAQAFLDPGVLVVKEGSTGATSYGPGGTTFVPAIPVEVVEPVGAGDAYAAGYLFGLLRDLPEPQRLRLGHLVAGAALRVTGDVAPLPRAPQLLAAASAEVD